MFYCSNTLTNASHTLTNASHNTLASIKYWYGYMCSCVYVLAFVGTHVHTYVRTYVCT